MGLEYPSEWWKSESVTHEQTNGQIGEEANIVFEKTLVDIY